MNQWVTNCKYEAVHCSRGILTICPVPPKNTTVLWMMNCNLAGVHCAFYYVLYWALLLLVGKNKVPCCIVQHISPCLKKANVSVWQCWDACRPGTAWKYFTPMLAAPWWLLTPSNPSLSFTPWMWWKNITMLHSSRYLHPNLHCKSKCPIADFSFPWIFEVILIRCQHESVQEWESNSLLTMSGTAVST